MASSSSSTSQPRNYDVFLSFRGEDTRKNFVDHFYSALVQQSIHTYKDDKTLRRGESIGPSLFAAIKESQIAVIIFSKNYASSSWCLEELAYIMKCKDVQGLIVMPVFYHVEPSEVRKQTGEFGKGFAKLADNINKVDSWKKALVAASELSGWETNKIANGHESKVIEKIVDTILDRLLSISLNVNEDLVGMTTRLRDLESRLDIQSDCVRMVGIWGVGGGGKTTLATSLYTKISHLFEGSCIVENIRQKVKYDLDKLQEKLLLGVSGKKVKVSGVEDGKNKIKRMLRSRKVLIVLDDVDNLKQLEALAGSTNWFVSGSRIIITTRDEHLLNTHKVDDVYRVRLLSNDEAIQLFDKHAYNGKNPIENYKELSSNVVSYAAGLPLALKILGNFLFDKDNKGWRSALARLKDIPEEEIVEQLKISYDGLKTEEKELFLDIACFFRKKNIHYAMEILEACGFHPRIGIEVLRQKALITINADDKFDMHDLVQEMGHHIVRGGHPNNPENHSRVWNNEEINNMSFEDATTENDKIEALRYDTIGRQQSLRFYKIVSNMKKLRFLIVDMRDKYDPDGGPNFLSNQLRYINWKGYPASPFADTIHLTKLVVLKLSDSLQRKLWTGKKRLPCLKVLELAHMTNLVSTPDFDGLPCLEALTVSSCNQLEEIHPSLGSHTSLEYVTVSYCSKLTTFPKFVHMENLTSLNLWGLFYLKSIEFNYNGLKHLRHLTFSYCHLKDRKILSKIGELSNLEELDLSGNDFREIDSSLLQLTRLKWLNLRACGRLVELPELPSSVAILIADDCYSLTWVRDFNRNCERLSRVSLVGGLRKYDVDVFLKYMLQGEAFENGSIRVRLEGFEIARGFKPHLLKGDTCTLQLPTNWSSDFCGFLMCAVVAIPLRSDCVEISMKQVMSGMEPHDEVIWKASDGGEGTWVGYVSFASLRHTCWWDPTSNKLSFSMSYQRYKDQECRGFGVRLVGRISSGIGPSDSSQFSPDFKIKHDLTVGSGPTDSSQFSQPLKIIHDSRSAILIGENDSYAV